jgi:hypothetical protein
MGYTALSIVRMKKHETNLGLTFWAREFYAREEKNASWIG